MKFRKQIAFLFTAFALFSYLSIKFYHQEDSEMVALVQHNYLPIYLLDKDDLLIPLQIEIEGGLDTNEQVSLIIAYLSGKQMINGFKPLFNQPWMPNNIKYSDGCVHIDLDESFLKYDKQHELKVLQAMVYSICSLEGVKEVKFTYKQKLMNYMPLSRTKINYPLNKDIGINHFEVNTSLHDSKMITIYYQKDDYYTLKSLRLKHEVKDLNSYIKLLGSDVSTTSLLKAPLHGLQINKIEGDLNNCKLYIDDNILVNQSEVKDDLWMLLKLNLQAYGVKTLSVFVDDKEVIKESLNKINYNLVSFE